MTEKIKYLEDIIVEVMEYQKNHGYRHWSVMFYEEEGELILAALRDYRRKWEEIIEKEKKDAQP
jgi:hypothetical protein